MNRKRFRGFLILIFTFIMGCSGNFGNLKPQSEGDSKITQRELIDNWSDCNICLSYYSWEPGWSTYLAVIVFDSKNDDRNILVRSRAGSNWSEVKDQEIWGPDNQLYGYIIYHGNLVEWVNAKLVDENTMQLSWRRIAIQGTPA